MVNISVSIPSVLVPWLDEYAKKHNLFMRDGSPATGKAASMKLQEVHEKELPK